jgi:hypothetical protein
MKSFRWDIGASSWVSIAVLAVFPGGVVPVGDVQDTVIRLIII